MVILVSGITTAGIFEDISTFDVSSDVFVFVLKSSYLGLRFGLLSPIF